MIFLIHSSVDVVLEGSFICTVTSEQPRFHLFEHYELDELLFSRRAESTKRVIKSAGYLFGGFCQLRAYRWKTYSTVMTLSITS